MNYLVALTRLPSKQLERLVNLSVSGSIARSAPPTLPRPQRQHRLDVRNRVAVVLAYAGGDSMAALARTNGVRRETISKIIRGAGDQVQLQRAISQEQITEAAALYRQGWSLARLAERYGFNGQTIHPHPSQARRRCHEGASRLA